MTYSQNSGEYWEEGPQQAPADAPEEFQSLSSLRVDASADFVNGMAIGESLVHYFGTSGIAEVDLAVNKGNVTVQTPANGYREQTDAWPANRTVSAIAHITLTDNCGYAAHASARGKTWIGWGGAQWGLQGATTANDATMTACPGGSRKHCHGLARWP